MRRFPYRVTFQAPVADRTPAGQVIAVDYENVEGLEDLPAHIIAVVEEERGERMTVTEDLFQIIVAGDRPIRNDMVALTSKGVFDVQRVANPTMRKRAVQATLVVAQRVAV